MSVDQLEGPVVELEKKMCETAFFFLVLTTHNPVAINAFVRFCLQVFSYLRLFSASGTYFKMSVLVTSTAIYNQAAHEDTTRPLLFPEHENQSSARAKIKTSTRLILAGSYHELLA